MLLSPQGSKLDDAQDISSFLLSFLHTFKLF
jgi:hypothetical protein